MPKEVREKMTDKELKKLSRLELLEILLEETKENEKLRAELKTANKIIKNATILSELIGKMDNTLDQAQNFTTKLHRMTEGISQVNSPAQRSYFNENQPRQNVFSASSAEIKSAKASDASHNISDKKLYVDILNYYLSNEAALNALPYDIQNDIRTRLRGILDAKK